MIHGAPGQPQVMLTSLSSPPHEAFLLLFSLPSPSFPTFFIGNPEHRCSGAMGHPSLTSQTTAVFERINEPRMANREAVGNPSRNDFPTSVLWIPAYARMTDKEAGHFSTLVNALRVIRMLNSYKRS